MEMDKCQCGWISKRSIYGNIIVNEKWNGLLYERKILCLDYVSLSINHWMIYGLLGTGCNVQEMRFFYQKEYYVFT